MLYCDSYIGSSVVLTAEYDGTVSCNVTERNCVDIYRRFGMYYLKMSENIYPHILKDKHFRFVHYLTTLVQLQQLKSAEKMRDMIKCGVQVRISKEALVAYCSTVSIIHRVE